MATILAVNDEAACHATESNGVLVACATARQKLEVGDYEGGVTALAPWWSIGNWPRHACLTNRASAELLLMTGILSGLIASTKQLPGGQRPAEGLLNGSVALFEQMRETSRASEARIELACCYFWQGLFDLARDVLRLSISALTDTNTEVRSVALIRLALVEHHAGRLHDALHILNEASSLVNKERPWIKGRFHLELATTLKDLGLAEGQDEHFEGSLTNYQQALVAFEELGNRRYIAIVENNLGYLLLTLRRFDEAQAHLQRAIELFEEFGDQVHGAQVKETIAQLHIASSHYEQADLAIKSALNTLEGSGEDALLAEALMTQGLVLCRLDHRQEAKPIIERARRVAERCGDRESAGRALLILIEEMCDQLPDDERREIGAQANQLLANSQQQATRERLRKSLEQIADAHTRHVAQREQEIHAQKMAALGELSFGVAHNVNNTLTGILGRAQLILRNSNDPGKVEAGLDLIIKSAEDGAHIIRRIQDFAR